MLNPQEQDLVLFVRPKRPEGASADSPRPRMDILDWVMQYKIITETVVNDEGFETFADVVVKQYVTKNGSGLILCRSVEGQKWLYDLIKPKLDKYDVWLQQPKSRTNLRVNLGGVMGEADIILKRALKIAHVDIQHEIVKKNEKILWSPKAVMVECKYSKSQKEQN